MHNILQIYAEIYENIANDVHMGRYGLILGANESYIDNKAIGTNFKVHLLEKKSACGNAHTSRRLVNLKGAFLGEKKRLRQCPHLAQACKYKSLPYIL